MKKVKTINNFRTVQHGYTEEMIPVADEESEIIMELNFKQFICVLADVLVKYAADENPQNFKTGQAEGTYPCLQTYMVVLAFGIVNT